MHDKRDELDKSQRQALDAAIRRSIEQAGRGEVAPASKIIAELRDRQRR